MGRPGPKPQNLVGHTFGKLTVTALHGRSGRRILWECRCECGGTTVARRDFLKTGQVKSCGCLHEYIGMSYSPEYRAFINAQTRCTNPKTPHWKDYGGRGIRFLFTSFFEFMDELGPKPSPKHSVDRIKTDGHYERGNVKWSTQKEQLANRRKKENSN